MDAAVSVLISGIALGCVYALVAEGVVLTYKTSAVFNIALGAQAYAGAAAMYGLNVQAGWPVIPSAIVSVLILGPGLGLALYWGLFRHARRMAETTRLLLGLGLLLLIPALVMGLWLGAGIRGNPPSLGPDGTMSIAGFTLTWDRAAPIIATLLVVGGVGWLFRSTTLGLRMRAVVESPRMVQLAGINPDRISSFSWALSGAVAALAGVLLAPLFGSVGLENYTLLLVAAIAAAVFGRLTSLPMTLVGALLLGLLQQILARYLPSDSVIAQGLRPSLPFVMLFALLVLVPAYRNFGGTPDPLAGVDPPQRTSATSKLKAPGGTLPWLFVSVVGVAFASAAFSNVWLLRLSTALVLGTIMLSITVLTGMSGQLSLCQAAFAGAGACTAGQLANHFNVPILLGAVAGAIVGGVVGALLALPTRRLRGIYLTLATLAFGLLVDQIIFPLEIVGGGPAGLEVPRPYQHKIVDFTSDRPFFILCALAFAGVSFIVLRLRSGTTGRYLDAIRGSETGVASVGIDPGRVKVIAFAVSAAIAAFGGVLLASLQGRAATADFTIAASLLWPVVIVTLGARSITAALIGGITLSILPDIFEAVGIDNPQVWQAVLFGAGALTFARNPEGILAMWRNRLEQLMGQTVTERTGPIEQVDIADLAPRPSPDAAAVAATVPDAAYVGAASAGNGYPPPPVEPDWSFAPPDDAEPVPPHAPTATTDRPGAAR